jgi:hypothetical protein
MKNELFSTVYVDMIIFSPSSPSNKPEELSKNEAIGK